MASPQSLRFEMVENKISPYHAYQNGILSLHSFESGSQVLVYAYFCN